MKLVNLSEEAVGRKAFVNLLPMQDGDVHETYADIQAISDEQGFQLATSLPEGIAAWIDWYRSWTDTAP